MHLMPYPFAKERGGGTKSVFFLNIYLIKMYGSQSLNHKMLRC